MVEKILSESLISDGEGLVRKLDEAGLGVSAALWLYFPDTQAWRLLLSFPGIKSKGPREAYSKVQTILNRLEKSDSQLSLDEVVLAKPDAPIINLLKQAIPTDRGIHHIRFSGKVINGQLIEDAFIYRLVAD